MFADLSGGPGTVPDQAEHRLPAWFGERPQDRLTAHLQRILAARGATFKS
jgi:hypothetical protein